MAKTITLSFMVCAITLGTMSIAMEQQPKNASLADITLLEISPESLKQLADEYEQFNQSNDPKELRLALFGVAAKLALTPLDKRDPKIEENAQAVYKLVTLHYPTQSVRDLQFLYGILLATQKPADKDVHPYRQYYTPVEQIRKVMKENDKERDTYQSKSEEIAREENSLTTQKAALQVQMAALQAQLDTLQGKIDATRAHKLGQLKELTLIVQANQTLNSHVACHALALQEHRDTLKKTVIDTITRYIDLKSKLAEAAVAHEKTNYMAQLEPLPAKIEADIQSLWYCMHYLQRVKLPDGTLSATDALKWKMGSINPQELGITNYDAYLKAKSQ